MSEPRYWFPAKRYGWGWGLPSTWEGWAVFGVYALVFAGGLVVERDRPVGSVLVVLVDSAALVAVCWWKGEPPGWRWGGPRGGRRA